MKSFFALSAVAFLLFAFTAAPVSYRIDTQQSKVTWTGYKVTGQHTGTVPVRTGDLKFDDGQLVGGSILIDMAALTVTDLSGEMKGKLEGHLKSPDFFGVEKYPTAKLTIDKVTSRGKAGDVRINGTLTIKETTRPVKFNAQLNERGNQVVGTAELTIDRTEYNVRYGSGSFFDNLGDNTIYDEFDLKIALVANK